MDYLALREQRRKWGKAYRDRRKAGITAKPRPRTSTSEEPVTPIANSDKNIAELSTMTPVEIQFADGCVWNGTMSRRMDEALADHHQQHGRGTKQEVTA
ncbi:hypothetical protein LCGC14_0446370 [marine sediment metagenome]|uniref:Uncharacterized protein n=1 Tax=marine sediment metagenome TaxID=412755 RepID=A0A0F9T2A7_9ZZZZ